MLAPAVRSGVVAFVPARIRVDLPAPTDDNLTQCHALVADGCPPDRLLAMESCPLQFGCGTSAGGPAAGGRRRQQAAEAPAPPPGATGPSGAGSSGSPSTVSQTATESASGHPSLCSLAGDDWLSTKVVGVLSGLLLLMATPMVSCQTVGYVGT